MKRRVRRGGKVSSRKTAKKTIQPAAGRSYDEQIAHEKRRAGQRLIQEAGIAWLSGYDTPEARWFGRYVNTNQRAVQEAARRKSKAGDLLNLTGHSVTPNKKQQRKISEAGRLARGERRDSIPDVDHPNQNVMVTTLPHAFRRLKQIKVQHQPAAERFVSDWENAGYSGLRSPGFDPRVDSSAVAHEGHLRAVEAQKRLAMVARYIGERNYDICTGVLIFNMNPTKAHAMGGRDHRSVNHDIEVALNALAAFYDPDRLARDPTWRAFKRVIEAGLDVIRQGREETR